MSLRLADAAIYLFIYCISAVATCLWIFKSNQTLVKPTSQPPWAVAGRLAIVFALGYGFVALLSPSAPGIIAISLAFILFLFTAVGSGAGLIGIPLFLGIQQFVLWFPSRYALVNQETTAPIPPNPMKAPPDELVGKTAITAGPLRPAGDVTLGNQRYAALSENQQYIEA